MEAVLQESAHDGLLIISARAFLIVVDFINPPLVCCIDHACIDHACVFASIRCTLRACLSLLCCSHAEVVLCHKYCHQVPDGHVFIYLFACFSECGLSINPPSVCYTPPGMSTQQAYGALYVLSILLCCIHAGAFLHQKCFNIVTDGHASAFFQSSSEQSVYIDGAGFRFSHCTNRSLHSCSHNAPRIQQRVTSFTHNLWRGIKT